MKLKFINSNELDRNLKATVHKTGKIGFTVAAAKKLDLTVNSGIAIAIDEEDENDDSLYVVVKDKCQKEHFKVSKAGDYYYTNAKALFDSLKIDYVNENIVYDISAVDIDVDLDLIYQFKRRLQTKKQKANQSA